MVDGAMTNHPVNRQFSGRLSMWLDRMGRGLRGWRGRWFVRRSRVLCCRLGFLRNRLERKTGGYGVGDTGGVEYD